MAPTAIATAMNNRSVLVTDFLFIVDPPAKPTYVSVGVTYN
jgi:hypothetical protein